MWPRFTFDDVRTIGHYLGVLVLFATFIYVVPFFVAIALGEWEPAARYLKAIGICLIVGSLLRFARIRPARLSRQQALAVTGLAWVVLAFFASIPLFQSGHYASYVDALFDGISGLTTTGATTIVDLDHLSVTDNMFRFMMHFLGGLGLVVVALALGLFGKSGGTTMYASEGRSEHVIPNVVQTTRFITRMALGFIIVATVVLAILLAFKGMEPLRAFFHGMWLAISGFITGGFAPMSDSVLYYHSAVVEIILMVLMIMGAINFTLHSEVWKGRIEPLFKDIETRTMVIWVLATLLIFTSSLVASGKFTDLTALLRRGLFMVVSAFTTTGFQNVTTNQITVVFSSGAFLVLGIIMAVGGGGGSTAGGMKFSRMGLILKSIVATVKQTLAPDSARTVVTYNHLGRQTLNEGAVKEAMTVSMLFIVTYLAGGLIGIAYGFDATQAIFESIAMTSNGGLSTIVGPGMPVGLEIFYMFQMWAGRLEFVTLLALMVQIALSLVPRGLRKAVITRTSAEPDGPFGSFDTTSTVAAGGFGFTRNGESRKAKALGVESAPKLKRATESISTMIPDEGAELSEVELTARQALSQLPGISAAPEAVAVPARGLEPEPAPMPSYLLDSMVTPTVAVAEPVATYVSEPVAYTPEAETTFDWASPVESVVEPISDWAAPVESAVEPVSDRAAEPAAEPSPEFVAWAAEPAAEQTSDYSLEPAAPYVFEPASPATVREPADEPTFAPEPARVAVPTHVTPAVPIPTTVRGEDLDD